MSFLCQHQVRNLQCNCLHCKSSWSSENSCSFHSFRLSSENWYHQIDNFSIQKKNKMRIINISQSISEWSFRMQHSNHLAQIKMHSNWDKFFQNLLSRKINFCLFSYEYFFYYNRTFLKIIYWLKMKVFYILQNLTWQTLLISQIIENDQQWYLYAFWEQETEKDWQIEHMFQENDFNWV